MSSDETGVTRTVRVRRSGELAAALAGFGLPAAEAEPAAAEAWSRRPRDASRASDPWTEGPRHRWIGVAVGAAVAVVFVLLVVADVL